MKRESSAPYRVVPGSPPELIVYDEAQPCPYLEGRLARLPLRIPARPLTRSELELRLTTGDRRQGVFFYHTSCPNCTACEPIRIDVQRFVPGRTHRRTLRRGDAALRVDLGPTLVDEARVNLYNRHKLLRGLGAGRAPIDLDGYREFLVLSSCDTFEIRYFLADELVAVAIVDRSERALSAVYCFYDPAFEHLGLGTYSILKQIELCRAWRLRYLYLGLYIEGSQHMAYKARFLPHERLLDGVWSEFTQP
ncbi:MAG TPA: arginyltransferase [Polyangiaceae bacterium]|nr:arginyltransferase [Polyangiaceae bacterium]